MDQTEMAVTNQCCPYMLCNGIYYALDYVFQKYNLDVKKMYCTMVETCFEESCYAYKM